jgi:hypothetical protein
MFTATDINIFTAAYGHTKVYLMLLKFAYVENGQVSQVFQLCFEHYNVWVIF